MYVLVDIAYRTLVRRANRSQAFFVVKVLTRKPYTELLWEHVYVQMLQKHIDTSTVFSIVLGVQDWTECAWQKAAITLFLSKYFETG